MAGALLPRGLHRSAARPGRRAAALALAAGGSGGDVRGDSSRLTLAQHCLIMSLGGNLMPKLDEIPAVGALAEMVRRAVREGRREGLPRGRGTTRRGLLSLGGSPGVGAGGG